MGALINGRYEAIERLGEGAEGTVLRCRDRVLDRDVALKATRGGARKSGDDLERLAAEYRRLARIGHPNLLAVHDIGRLTDSEGDLEAGALFFTSDLVQGSDLLGWADTKPGRPAILSRLEEVARGLDAVHAAGLVHCDLKPTNIVVGDDGAVVLDFGLSVERGARGTARGTLAYMDRRALGGAPDVESDLHALGAAFYRALCGVPPYPHADPATLLGALETGSPMPLASARPDLEGPIALVIDALLVDETRPRSAAQLLDRLWSAREALGLVADSDAPEAASARRHPPRLVGRDALLAALVHHVRTDPSAGQPALVRLVGPPGHGGRAVLAELARRAQLAHLALDPPIEILAGDTARLLDVLAPASDRGKLTGRAVALASADAAIAALASRAASRPVVLVLDQPDADVRAAELVRALAAGASGLEAVAVTVVARAATAAVNADDAAVDVPLGPLDEGATMELARAILPAPPDPEWIDDLCEVALGRPGPIVGALQAAALAHVLPPAAELLSGDHRADLAAVLAEAAGRLDASERDVLAATAVLGTSASSAISDLAETSIELVYDALTQLQALGWVEVDDQGARCKTPAHAGAAESTLSPTRRRDWHRRALESDVPLSSAEIARHVAVTGPAKRAVAAFRDAAAEAFARGDLDTARRLASDALDKGEGQIASELSLLLAEIALELGDYTAATAAAERAARSRDSDRKRRAQLVLGRSRARSGDLAGAERALAPLTEDHPDDRSAAGALARVLVSRGRFDEAARRAGDPAALIAASAAGDDDDGLALCLEAAGLAALYAGDRDVATRCFGELERRATTASDDALAGRAASLLGLVAHHGGDVVAATGRYAQAAELAQRTGQIHAAAACEINRATAEADRGRFSSALGALDSALVSLRRIGSISELPAALYNRAHALFSLGDLSAAQKTAERALEHAVASGNPQFELYSHLLVGDTHRRRKDLDLADAAYQRASDVAERGGAAVDTIAIDLAVAELRAERGDPAALEHVATAEAAAGDGHNRERVLLAAARVSLRLGQRRDGLTSELEAAAERAHASGRDDLFWRLSALAARLAVASGERDHATRHARAAAVELERALAAAPPSRRVAMREDPDVIALAGLEAELELSGWRGVPDARTASATESEATLRRLLSLSRRLNSELRVAPLLDQVIDTAIELTGAERGFLLLSEPGKTDLDVAVARNIDREGLADDELALSRSIAERAARSGELVLALDAAFDERFGSAESVAAMRLRSVLAVPLRHRGELIGTIYVDHRFQSGAFDERAVHLCRELANIAAVAIGNARVVEENQRRRAEIAELNGRLEEELSDRENELAAAKLKIPPGEAHGLATPEIVGSSPAIRGLLELVERLARADLPVVIGGESGSGKELVARALHRLSPRRHGPFVAVNCGAVPEALLESELFGHVRGSFTGAERTRRGHFEIADGGTLFLDEIADTSAAMQTKLLRVIQEGELRRLGDEDVRRVDVRIVAATNRGLRELVDAGQFREDLFFRLQVLSVTVPPLRERASDIPELAVHILGRLADRGTPRRLSAAATAALCRYHWPGNVRELENELARAAALSSDAIEREHLSDAIRAAPTTRAAPGRDNLTIKEHVEALERELITAALERTGGNQTRAAKILGLSRYGLQKKLKRYELSA